MMSLLTSVKRTNTLRRILLQLGSPQLRPTVICEDNQPLIAEVLQNRITTNVRHLDIPLAYLQEQYQRLAFDLKYTHTTLQLADINTKPHGGPSLQKATLSLIGFQHYPPSTSNHYKLLELEKYNISENNTSQRRLPKS